VQLTAGLSHCLRTAVAAAAAAALLRRDESTLVASVYRALTPLLPATCRPSHRSSAVRTVSLRSPRTSLRRSDSADFFSDSIVDVVCVVVSVYRFTL